MYKLLSLLLLLFTVESLSAERLRAHKGHRLEISDDSSSIHLRAFDHKALSIYKSNADFNYYIKNEEQNPSMWDKFWDWFWHFIKNLFGNQKKPEASPNSPLLNYILFVIVVGGLVYTIVKLLGDDLSNIFSKKSEEPHIPFSENLENIYEISFESEIENALQNGDYRLAVRLLFLSTLKILNDEALIDWQIGKTNTAYLNEMQSAKHRADFSLLTKQFEYVWYGGFYINPKSFKLISTQFSDFKASLR